MLRIRTLLLFLLLSLLPASTHAQSAYRTLHAVQGASPWWDEAFPYRLPVTTSGQGVASASIDFGAQLNALGLNNALLDLRSIRVVASDGGSLPYRETHSSLLEDAESPQIGWSASGVYWTVNDGSAQADTARASQGNSSLKATVENWPGGYGYPGVELHIADGDPLTDWSLYETFLYDVWPAVNASALDQAPDLYWYKLYDACAGSAITQGGPPLALDRWNPVSVSLYPLDNCWPADGLDLGNITRMEFHTRDNDTVNGNSGLWDDGDQLTLWFDNLRLVDQNNGTIQWQTLPGVDTYYIYFDVLTHEGHPQPNLLESISGTPVPATPGAAEAGGYYHQISGAAVPAGWRLWTAPTVEKVTREMAVPADSAPLKIYAARGEFESFQIVVNPDVQASAAVNASAFSPLSSPASRLALSTIPAPTLHLVEYVPITTAGDHFDRFGDWPDPLLPLDLGDNVTLPAGANQPLWFTIQVPWDAAAGLYQGTITIGAATIPVELEVWDFSLPREIHLASEWGFSWSSVVEDYRGTVGGSVQACYWDVVDALKQQFADSRLIPKGVAWPAGLNYPGGIEYDCNGNLDPDAWGDWDFATLGGKYAHGEQGFNGGYGFPEFQAFGPTSNSPPDSLPYSFCGQSRSGTLGDAAYQAAWTQYLSALDDYIVSDGYAQGAYYHIVNEPQTSADYDIVGQISALTEAAAPNLRQMVSEQVEPQIYNYPGAKIDIWMPTISSYEPQKSHDRQQLGEQVWWYYLYGDDPPLPNPVLMSHPGIEARISPWLAWNERVDGLLHYSTTDWSSNPWTNPNVTGQDNGDGFLFYPPHQDGTPLDSCGENGNRLVPSIRWVNLRDGMEDYEYLWLLSGGDPQVGAANASDAFVAQLVDSRTLFSRVPTDLEATRAALAAAILGNPSGPTALKQASSGGVAPGSIFTYTLSYYHTGNPATLAVTDTLPAQTLLQSASGPGSVTVNGQTVLWTTPVTGTEWVRLDITVQAGNSPALVTNTAVFSALQDFSASVPVVIYARQVFLPVVGKP